MSQTIVLATDGSDPARKAESFLTEIFSPDTDQVVVLNVVEEIPYIGEGADFSSLEEKLSDHSKETIESAAERLRDHGFDVETKILKGPAGRGICEFARDRGADSIVMGRRGRGTVGELLLGSVSQYVIHHAPCPVTVVAADTE